MKVLIWICCMFILSLITVLINYTGILLGGIPTFILGVLMFYIARILCKKWDEHKINREKIGIKKYKILIKERNVKKHL